MAETIERELLDLERRYWQALKDKNVDAAMELTDEPCVVAGAQGVGLIDHPTYIRMMEHASWTIAAFEIGDDVQVRMLGDDTALLAYTVHEELEVDGEEVAFDAADTRSGFGATTAGCARRIRSRSRATRTGATARRDSPTAGSRDLSSTGARRGTRPPSSAAARQRP
jgi:hypothetical protein